MEHIVMFGLGVLMLVLAFLIGVRGKIGLVHSYHYKRVAQEDRPTFCRGVGIGTALAALAFLLFPVLDAYVPAAAPWVMGTLAVAGAIVAIITILWLNKGLF